jgi:1,4-dihydroxy-2-naphthoate octaprenyltransferase
MARFRDWLDACRPKTLVAAAAPVALGGAVFAAYGNGAPKSGFALLLLASCLCFALCVQVACNFANDLGDSLRGADTAARVGPRRAVSAGDISPAAMRRGIWIACALALILGSPVALLSPWLLLAGLLAIACALAYTLGPFPLAYRGLGDVFVIACFGVQATVLTTWALGMAWKAAIMPWCAATLAGLGLGLLADNILVANNARDYETDLAVGKLRARFRPQSPRLKFARRSRPARPGLRLGPAGAAAARRLAPPGLPAGRPAG